MLRASKLTPDAHCEKGVPTLGTGGRGRRKKVAQCLVIVFLQQVAQVRDPAEQHAEREFFVARGQLGSDSFGKRRCGEGGEPAHISRLMSRQAHHSAF